MSGSAPPPFKVPGHEWDPVRKRFFKSQPAAQPQHIPGPRGAGSSASGTGLSSKRNRRGRGRGRDDAPPSPSPNQAQEWRDHASRTREALRHRLGIAARPGMAGSMASLRSAGRLTLHESTRRLANPARHIASRLSLSHRVSLPFLGAPTADSAINHLALGEDAGCLYASSRTSTYRVDLIPLDHPGADSRPYFSLVWHEGGASVVVDARCPRPGFRKQTLHSRQAGCQIQIGMDRGSPHVYLRSGSKDMRTPHVLPCAELGLAYGIGPVVMVGSIREEKTFTLSDARRLGSDAMCVCFATDTRVYAGLRSGRVVGFDVGRTDQRDAPPRGSHDAGFEELAQGAGSVTHVVGVGESELLVAWTTGEQMRLVDLVTKQTKVSFVGHVNSYTFNLALAVDAHHRLVACAGQDDQVRIWSLDDPEPLSSSSSSSSGSGGDANPNLGQDGSRIDGHSARASSDAAAEAQPEQGRRLHGFRWNNGAAERVGALQWTPRFDDLVVARQQAFTTSSSAAGPNRRRVIGGGGGGGGGHSRAQEGLDDDDDDDDFLATLSHGPPALIVAAGDQLYFYE
ncbi:uncharacterized protein PSFLO_05757 [Pseudozyma flocculosa]|uniref:WD40 repeat-like protein n=1 Tax=Pseudozyma flocculosa TaxID=84751 RepID=A0A5C3F9F9_9BASI|nr:uncharacterized protein PSFLO_05757 [Pseudozyma flocculosa]